MDTNGTLLRRAALAALLAAAGAATPAFADARLAARLAPGAAPGEIVFELANEGTEAVSVLRTGTPLEATLSEDLFDVRRLVKGWPGVERPVFTGRVYKRVAPRPEDFVEIAPGESLSAEVDLERFYDVPDADDYDVDFRGRILVAPDPDTARPDFRSPELRARQRPHDGHAHGLIDATPDVEGLDVTLRPSLRKFRARPPTYNGCSVEQQDILVEATVAAEGIAGEALASLNGLPESQRATAPRYINWFGRYSAANYRTVSDGYAAILDSLSGETLNYDCTCREEGVYAYVYPFQLHDIYVCPVFFRASVLGTDSRAGTIVHELSHFEALVGTDDNAYGQGAAAALASSDPESAIDNADNFEYFAENTPALPMENDGGPVTPPAEDDPPPSTGGDAGRFAELPLDTVVGGTLDEGEVALYRTDEADTLRLTSLAGDVDLYVFNEPEFSDETLVCTADAYSEDSTLDVCELPLGDTHYVAVRGFTDGSRYELVATARSAPPSTIDPAVALALGLSDSRSLAAEGTAFYTVPAPARLELTSTSGNADLYVFADPSLESDRLICVSRRAGTALDACDLTGSGTAYVVVHMPVAGTYRLAALEPGGTSTPGGTATPPDDAPVIAGGSSGDDGGGGLGGTGWPWLLLGGATLALRRVRPTARGARRDAP